MEQNNAGVLSEIADSLVTFDKDDQGISVNVADGLFAIANALQYAARHLGKEDACGPMGAIEALGKCVIDGTESVSHATESIASAIEEGFESLGHAIQSGLEALAQAIDSHSSK